MQDYDIEDAVYSKEVIKKMTFLLTCLTPRQEMIIRMRFGIGYGYEHTYKQIGLRFNMSPELVRHLTMKILKKLNKKTIYNFVMGQDQ